MTADNQAPNELARVLTGERGWTGWPQDWVKAQIRIVLADNARLTAALVEAKTDRADWEDLYEETKHQWRKAEADAATGRAVARRYEDRWQPTYYVGGRITWLRAGEDDDDDEEEATPDEAAWLASLDAEEGT